MLDQDLNNSSISNEAINFQASSNLGKSLEELFQKIIDYRDDLIKTKNMKYDSDLCNAIYGYASKIKFSTEFKNILNKEAHINVTKLMIDMSISANITGAFFTVTMDINDFNDVFNVDKMINVAAMTAGKSNLSKVKDKSTYEAIAEYMKYLDGAIDQNTGILKSNKEITIGFMGMDFNLAFLGEAFTTWTSSDKRTPDDFKDKGLSSISTFTAKEITAIMLHEIGHTYAVLEGCASFYYQFLSTHQILKYRQKYEDNETTLKNFLNDKNKLKDIIKKIDIDGSISRLFDFVLKSVSSLQEYTHNFDLDSLSVTSRKIFQFAIFIISIFIPILYNVIMIGLMFHSSLLVIEPEVLHIGSTKTSDTKVSRRNWFHHERAADEFAIKHGYGADLSEGLRKLIYITSRSPIIKLPIKIGLIGNLIENYGTMLLHAIYGYLPICLKHNIFISIIFQLMKSTASVMSLIAIMYNPVKLISSLRQENTKYESGFIKSHLVRIDRIIETYMGIFKDPSIPNDIKDHYVEDIKRLKASRNELSKDMIINDALNLAISKVVSFIAFIPTTKFLSMAISGHLSEDYAKLQNQLDSLMNNELFYQSYRLGNLEK
jgi:hypothetical protein